MSLSNNKAASSILACWDGLVGTGVALPELSEQLWKLSLFCDDPETTSLNTPGGCDGVSGGKDKSGVLGGGGVGIHLGEGGGIGVGTLGIPAGRREGYNPSDGQ